MFDLTHWTDDDLRRFLVVRQEFFLDPMGSNRDRFFEASMLLQRALFDWYLKPTGKFEGMLSLVTSHAEGWSKLRKEEQRTMGERRFALNSARADTPAVESSVSENQWQRIFGSLGLGLSDPGTFDRFLVQLDEETNPSLRVNHRYIGELLPHDNMISYLSSITATFLNENAIIGKVSPCVTHMEEAAIHWLLTLVGWDGLLAVDPKATSVPLQRLPTAPSPNHHYQRWERDEPTGTIVAGGTIANISALLIARNAVFDYLLGWEGAMQMLGPVTAWEVVKTVWGYQRMVVVTSLGTHYSVKKSALQAGVSPWNIIEVRGSTNPWRLDRAALEAAMGELEGSSSLVIAVVPIAGKTETGYVDDLRGIAMLLNELAAARHDWKTPSSTALPRYSEVLDRLQDPKRREAVRHVITEQLKDSREAIRQFDVLAGDARKEKSNAAEMRRREESGTNEIEDARHNRLFIHVDAAHGVGYLTVPKLRHGAFSGIELADTVTLDGHKSLYCYYPCGGLLIRTTRWARTLSAGQTDYISEESNYEAYPESVEFFERLRGETPNPEDRLMPHELSVRQRDMYRLVGIQTLTGRSLAAERSELTHQPFNQYLEGSRGPQGIMQLYFNLATLGLRGYRSILEWTHLLSKRCEEAISIGLTDCRLVTDQPMPESVRATDKLHAIAASNPALNDVKCDHPARLIMPIAGGRFLRLSNGTCNQVLMTYIPGREAKLIASTGPAYWKESSDKGVSRLRETMAYLWRVNEHLWYEHIYANPTFTYYLGHTSLELKLPGSKDPKQRADDLASLLQGWSAWLHPQEGRNAFLQALAEEVAQDEERKEKHPVPYRTPQTALKFFCHKVIVMHPYTDESLIGDMLRRVAFWGERSVTDVRISDTIADVLKERGKP